MRTETVPHVYSLDAWLAEHREKLRFPVTGRRVWEPFADCTIQAVSGPYERTDYHLAPYDEYYYQYRGDMYVNLMTEEGSARIDIREGEMCALPRNVYHSPQRPDPASVGIVIERVRPRGVLESFVWFCPECDSKVHEVKVEFGPLVEGASSAFEQFYRAGADDRTCAACGTVHPGSRPGA